MLDNIKKGSGTSTLFNFCFPNSTYRYHICRALVTQSIEITNVGVTRLPPTVFANWKLILRNLISLRFWHTCIRGLYSKYPEYSRRPSNKDPIRSRSTADELTWRRAACRYPAPRGAHAWSRPGPASTAQGTRPQPCKFIGQVWVFHFFHFPIKL